VVYWIPASPEVRPGLKLRLCETGIEEWTVNQTFTTCPDVPPVPHRLGTPDPALSRSFLQRRDHLILSSHTGGCWLEARSLRMKPFLDGPLSKK